MRFRHIALAAAIATIPVSAAQSAILPSPALSAPVRGWTAVAGLSGPEVVELARSLPVEAEASGNLPWCDAAPVISGALKAEFEENLIARRADGTQLWGSDLMGTWTVLLERADNTNCVIASGIGYQDGVDPGAFYAKVGLI
ncbi:hypothetical protein [Paracoccus sp. MC1862]|uniref:hypothetical protein n=1 Tax=Paracoccus sp. MC1862 TaxID=2760307 RepID=UPI0016012486|nr:hypothetical protein [Paracoccus sp. MC1862]MBB1498530.1 hypothetical protein [Paracoccus sp. MC1862]QQO43878.1 hypothetical protein JGR78_10610 [Paracoccus sp. MC1862]